MKRAEKRREFTEGAAVQPGTQVNVLLDREGRENGEDVIERLERYAQAIARKLLSRYDSAHDDAWHEDITQSLLLAGWQVWRDTGDEAKARHRMRSRAVNEKKRLYRTLTEQPRPVGSGGFPAEGTAHDRQGRHADGHEHGARSHHRLLGRR